MSRRKKKPPSFEKALERLEEIVEKLEGEDLGLDAALALFEEGIALSRFCHGKLEEVEKRVEIVLKESGDDWKTAPFGEEEVAGAESAAEEDSTDEP